MAAKNPQALALQSGEHSDIAVAATMSGEIHCESGRARIVNQRLGIGWLMRAGECCLLRSDTRYRITALTCVQIAIYPKLTSSSQKKS